MKIDYQKIHSIFDGLMVDFCASCQGSCEQNQIAVLLPEEEVFISTQINMSKEAFVDRFCTTIDFGHQEILILKTGICPFLNESFRCELEINQCKVVQCMLYPVLISSSLKKGEVVVDHEHCPYASRVSLRFKEQAATVLRVLQNNIPQWWLDCADIIDANIYDYDELEKYSKLSKITIQELNQCILQNKLML